MANICKNYITVIGLQEAAETFINTLSLEMFNIDLRNPKLELWGDQNSGINPQDWYRMLSDEYRNEGCYAARLGVLYMEKPYERFGVTAPCFYAETKWNPAVGELVKVSRKFPDLTFHIEWMRLQDGPSGEYVVGNGEVKESVMRRKSWYLFDSLLYPIASLLPARMHYTLAQHAALRFGDAIQTLDDIRTVLDDRRFTASPYQSLREPSRVAKTRTALNAAIEQLENTAKLLDFEGVFLETSSCKKEFERRENAKTNDAERIPECDFVSKLSSV
jgi:hypothetical protein